jgi:hypothetical protein
MVVLPCISFNVVSNISFSVSTSSYEMGSSNTIRPDSNKNDLARDNF